MEYSPPEEFFKRMRLRPDALQPFGFEKKLVEKTVSHI